MFSAAGHQRVWDHFTKAQRKNIETWQKMTQVISSLWASDINNGYLLWLFIIFPILSSDASDMVDDRHRESQSTYKIILFLLRSGGKMIVGQPNIGKLNPPY